MKTKSTNTFLIIGAVVIAAVVIYFVVGNKKSGQKFVAEDSAPSFIKQGELIFVDTADSDTLAVIDIEIADNDQETAQGLMYRTSMPENAGMLFLMKTEQMQSFWMKNTYIPLDMIFVNSQKEIVTIRHNTTPMKESSYYSTKPALYVVEVNAGFCRKNNIKEGDKIEFSSNK